MLKEEPCVTLAEEGLNVADIDGAVLTSKDADPSSGVHVPETLILTDCELAFPLATAVVHETLEPLMLFVWLSETLQTLQSVRSRYAEVQSPDHPDAVIVNAFPAITVPESAPDCVTLALVAAKATVGAKSNKNIIRSILFICSPSAISDTEPSFECFVSLRRLYIEEYLVISCLTTP